MNKLSEKAEIAIRESLNNGLLRQTPPKKDTLAFAAWWAIMFECNPFKAKISWAMQMSMEQAEIRKEVESWWASLSPSTRQVLESGLDKDRRALQSMGVW